jgi:hypothetical protein
MAVTRFTRRRFVKTGIVATLAAGVSLEAGAKDAVAGPESDLVVGHFVLAREARVGIVKLINGESAEVRLDSSAFVAHGTDGIVDTLERFVPGEEVAVRGMNVAGVITATELQSVYTSVAGTMNGLPDGRSLSTSSGRVHVPEDVFQAAGPAVRTGSQCTATIWTNPATGEATAVDLIGT